MAYCFVLAFLFLPSGSGLRGIAATCFFPNGDVEPSHLPCTSPSGTSVCCSEGFQCLSNGLCGDPRYDNFERVLRGACTDKDWGAGCTGFCKTSWPDRDETINYCGNGKWCCSGSECCDEQKDILDLGVPTVVATVGYVTATKTSSTETSSTETSFTETSSTETSSTETSSTETSSTETSSTETSSTKTATSSNPSATTSSESTPESTESPAINQPHKKSNSLAIGVGIGVGASVLFIGALIGLWRMRRRRIRGPQKVVELPANESSSRGNTSEAEKYRQELQGDGPPVGELATRADPGEMEAAARMHYSNRAKDRSFFELEGSGLFKEKDDRRFPEMS